MTAIDNGHVVLLCHLVDGVEKTVEIGFGVDVFLAMSTKQDVALGLQPKLRVIS